MKKLVCEFVGTMMLVLLACGIAVATDVHYLGTALAFGLVIVAMAYSIGNVSGCHINPAVSLGMAMSGRMSWREFWQYVIAQVLGAITGAAILVVILDSFKNLSGQGVVMKKEWEATPDERTRKSHMDMDGEEQEKHT